MRWRRSRPPVAPEAAASGERSNQPLNSALSAQARASNALALGVTLTLGTGLLFWYYAHAATRPARTRAQAQQRSDARAQSEMPLPALGALVPPTAVIASAAPVGMSSEAAASPLAMPTGAVNVGPAMAPAPVLSPAPAATNVAASPPAPGTHVSALERRLSGAAFVASTGAPTVSTEGTGTPESMSSSMSNNAAGGANPVATLSPWLKGSSTATVLAQRLPTEQLLLPKGAFIDCTLETAIDSTLPGMTTCVTATDTFSADGNVVLLERGTKLVGETRGQVQQGAARVFVLWTEARTPTGVVVPLDSPGADELGRSGLPGEVERHFWQRFGAAILISTIQGGVQAALQSTTNDSGAVIYNPSGAQDVATEVLKGTLNIAPTVVKHNGDRIQVLVARDIDFRSVYALRVAGSTP